MIPLNTQLGLPPRAFWYVALRSFVAAFFTLLVGSLVQLLTSLPGATCTGHPCNPASGAHLAAFIYLFGAFLVVRAAFNFKWFSFVVTDRSLTINSGVLSRNACTLRFDRIQDVSTHANLLHLLLGLKAISIWTASPDQRVGNARRPDGFIVLTADDADWLRDYLSDPPAAGGASSAGSNRETDTVHAAAQQGDGAVVTAFIVAAGLVILAVMAASKSAPPVPPGAATPPSGVTAQAPVRAASHGQHDRSHAHVARSQPGQVAQVPEAAPDPPPIAQPDQSDYGIACVIHPQAATAGLLSCADLAMGHRCAHAQDFPSKPTAEPAVLTLVNRSGENLKLYWLNFSGGRTLYASLRPGGHVDQQSHAGAHWLVSAADGQCLGVFDAATMKIGIF